MYNESIRRKDFFMKENKNETNKNLNYYISHQDELVKKYNGRYIIIVDEDVYGAYDSLRKAAEAAKKELSDKNDYQIQFVEPGKDSYTKIISRVKLHA